MFEKVIDLDEIYKLDKNLFWKTNKKHKMKKGTLI
jgi:hypothetical protein